MKHYIQQLVYLHEDGNFAKGELVYCHGFINDAHCVIVTNNNKIVHGMHPNSFRLYNEEQDEEYVWFDSNKHVRAMRVNDECPNWKYDGWDKYL